MYLINPTPPPQIIPEYKANKSSPLILPKKQGEVDGCCFGLSSKLNKRTPHTQYPLCHYAQICVNFLTVFFDIFDLK